MSRGIVRHIPTHVLLLGTCGASPSSGLDLGDVIVGTSVKLVDSAVVEGRAAMPFASDALPLDDTMVGALVAAGAKRAKIANTVGITTDDALATKLAEQGHVEHLEAYGVARACQAASVGCTIVLGIANAVGSRGRAEWRANHVSASGRAAEVAWSALESVRRSTTTHSPA
jgi:nucleoside phosphorylase